MSQWIQHGGTILLKNEHLVAKKYFLNTLISEARIHHGKRKPEFRDS